MITKQEYEVYAQQVKDFLNQDIEQQFLTLFIDKYEKYFTTKGEWDKRKRYFCFEIHVYKNKLDLLRLGELLTKIGNFVKDNNNGEIYMLSNLYFETNLIIKIKFIPYDFAAKILLNQEY